MFLTKNLQFLYGKYYGILFEKYVGSKSIDHLDDYHKRKDNFL